MTFKEKLVELMQAKRNVEVLLGSLISPQGLISDVQDDFIIFIENGGDTDLIPLDKIIGVGYQ